VTSSTPAGGDNTGRDANERAFIADAMRDAAGYLTKSANRTSTSADRYNDSRSDTLNRVARHYYNAAEEIRRAAAAVLAGPVEQVAECVDDAVPLVPAATAQSPAIARLIEAACAHADQPDQPAVLNRATTDGLIAAVADYRASALNDRDDDEDDVPNEALVKAAQRRRELRAGSVTTTPTEPAPGIEEAATQAAAVMARHWIDPTRTDPDRNDYCVCGGWISDVMSEGWDDHLAGALADAGLLRSPVAGVITTPDPAALAQLLHAVAAARREFISKTGERPRTDELISHEAAVFDVAAALAEGAFHHLYDWLPSWRWTAAMVHRSQMGTSAATTWSDVAALAGSTPKGTDHE
jgi:hypothetical protein